MVNMASKNISSCTVSYTALPMKTDLHFQPTLSSVSINQNKTSSSAPSEKLLNKKAQSNTKDSKSKSVNKKGQNDIETLNKFQSLSPPVDEEMDTTQSPRPSRSHSRSRSRSKNISPIKVR